MGRLGRRGRARQRLNAEERLGFRRRHGLRLGTGGTDSSGGGLVVGPLDGAAGALPYWGWPFLCCSFSASTSASQLIMLSYQSCRVTMPATSWVPSIVTTRCRIPMLMNHWYTLAAGVLSSMHQGERSMTEATFTDSLSNTCPSFSLRSACKSLLLTSPRNVTSVIRSRTTGKPLCSVLLKTCSMKSASSTSLRHTGMKCRP
mmetsp:Transcript_11023/g.27324  ORF Transcript_11023/g.27324 Transcript_11023/m.27324 type:complete len:202 (+) Transcript_11023:368-973(+)